MNNSAGPEELDESGLTVEHFMNAIYQDRLKIDAEARELLSNLSAHRVLFAPFGEMDFMPLHRLTHLFDVFIFCDFRLTDDSVCDLLRNTKELADKGLGLSDQLATGVRADCPPEIMENLAHFGDMPWIFDVQRPNTLEPFMRAVKLRRRVGDVARFFWFVTIGGNPLRAYTHLFTAKSIAPDMLWLPCPLGVDLNEWNECVSPGGEIGQLFGPGTPQPKFIAASQTHRAWQQTIFFQRSYMPIPGPDLGIYALPGVAPSPEPAAPMQTSPRTVRVSRTPIHPAKIVDEGLVVLTEREFRQHQWPADKILLNVHRVHPVDREQFQPNLPRLRLRGEPLAKALEVVETYCREHGIKRVATSRLGYEDEGPLLRKWAEHPGQVERLTLYSEGDGDWLSLSGYGEAIK